MEYDSYTSGFKFKCTKDLTKADYIAICEQLSAQLNFIINPEPIWEGGFLFTNTKGFKTMRHHVTLNNKDVKWPWITPNTVFEWKDSQEILWPINSECDTFLKAFRGADIWTLEQLKIFSKVFEFYGIKTKKMPTKTSLKQIAFTNHNN